MLAFWSGSHTCGAKHPSDWAIPQPLDQYFKQNAWRFFPRWPRQRVFSFVVFQNCGTLQNPLPCIFFSFKCHYEITAVGNYSIFQVYRNVSGKRKESIHRALKLQRGELRNLRFSHPMLCSVTSKSYFKSGHREIFLNDLALELNDQDDV